MPELSTDIFVDITVSLTGASAERFSFGTLLGIFDHSVTANRADGPYRDITEVEAAGFTSVAAAEVHAWASAVFGEHDNTIDMIYIGREDALDASWTVTLGAVEDELGTENFYFLTIESRAEADILLAAAWAETRQKVYVAQTGDAAVLAGTAGNVAEDLATAGYHRTVLVYHQYGTASAGSTPADGYLDGAVASCGGGLNLDSPNGAGTWHYLQLSGVTPDLVAPGEANAIYTESANIFGQANKLKFLSKGTASSGRFVDVMTSADWLTARMGEEILSTLVGTKPKVPYTESGLAIIRAAGQLVFDRGILFGHLSDDPDYAPTITMPRIATVSKNNKTIRKATSTAKAWLSGAIHSVTMTINVEQ